MAAEKLDRALKDEKLWQPYSASDGLGRWRESLTTIAFQHGLKDLRKTLEDMGLGDMEIPQEAIDSARDADAEPCL